MKTAGPVHRSGIEAERAIQKLFSDSSAMLANCMAARHLIEYSKIAEERFAERAR